MKKLVFAVVVALCGAQTQAQGISLVECNFDAGPREWVPQVMAFAVQPGTKSAVVSDPILLHFTNAPAKARVTSNTSSRTKLRWQVNVADRRGTRTTMVYTATYNKARQSMHLRASALGFSESFAKNGQCRQMPVEQAEAFRRAMESFAQQ
ncbi:MAG: hypothetical protein AAF667_02605 [Pseudomonadota bacterium]